MRAKRAQNQNIDVTLPNLNIREPISGQIINHIPNKAPINPKFLLLVSLSGDMSVSIAWSMEILPQVIPLIALERRNIQYCWLIKSIRYEIIVPIIQTTNGRFLPCLSLYCPRNGAAKNANRE